MHTHHPSLARILVLTAFTALAASAGEFTSTATTGDWTIADRWTLTDGTDANANDYPDIGDAALIGHGKSVLGDVSFGTSEFDSAWTGGSLSVSSGATLTHVAGSSLTFSGGDRDLASGGVFLNLGTYRHESSTGRIDITGTGSTFRNSGLFVGDHAGTTGNRQFSLRTGAVFENTANGTLRAQAGVTRWEISNQGIWVNNGGTVETINGSFLINTRVTSTGGDYKLADGTSLTLGSAHVVDGFVASVQQTGVGGVGPGNTGRILTTGLTFNNNSELNVQGGGGLWWTGGNLAVGSNVVTHEGEIRFSRASDGVITGTTGTFANNGSYAHDSGSRLRLEGTVNNAGTWEIVSGDSDTNVITFNNASAAFNNSGLFLKSGGSGMRTLEGQSAVFDNTGGIVQVEAGTLRFTTVTTPGYTSSTVEEGAWRAVGGDLLMTAANGRANITAIGANAEIILSGDSLLDRLGSATESTTLSTIEGRFGLWDEKIFALNVASVTVAGTLEFGLSAFSDQGDGYDDLTRLDINGDVDFTGGSLFVNDRGLSEGTYRLITWTGDRTGTLSLENNTNGSLAWSLSTMDTGSGHVDLVVALIPEPGSILLFGVGLLTLAFLRRR